MRILRAPRSKSHAWNSGRADERVGGEPRAGPAPERGARRGADADRRRARASRDALAARVGGRPARAAHPHALGRHRPRHEHLPRAGAPRPPDRLPVGCPAALRGPRRAERRGALAARSLPLRCGRWDGALGSRQRAATRRGGSADPRAARPRAGAGRRPGDGAGRRRGHRRAPLRQGSVVSAERAGCGHGRADPGLSRSAARTGRRHPALRLPPGGDRRLDRSGATRRRRRGDRRLVDHRPRSQLGQDDHQHPGLRSHPELVPELARDARGRRATHQAGDPHRHEVDRLPGRGPTVPAEADRPPQALPRRASSGGRGCQPSGGRRSGGPRRRPAIDQPRLLPRLLRGVPRGQRTPPPRHALHGAPARPRRARIAARALRLRRHDGLEGLRRDPGRSLRSSARRAALLRAAGLPGADR